MRSGSLFFALAAFAVVASSAPGQEEEVPGERASKPPVAITFTPPDMAGTIVLGIFDGAGRLARALSFEPGAPGLKVDTNGYIATWDGRDAAGKACAAGRYSAHGYVVGDGLEISGEAFHFNDWAAEDHVPAVGVKLCQWPDALGVELATAPKPVWAKIRENGTLEVTTEPPSAAKGTPPEPVPATTPPPIAQAPGREGSRWLIVEDAGLHAVAQIARDGTPERELRVAKDEPQPVEILASPTEDAILLRETAAGGVERVRLLRRAAVPPAADKEGKIVADWEVAFERTRQPCAKFGVVDGKLTADAGAAEPETTLRVSLVENALEPGSRAQLQLSAVPTHPGSALATVEGLRLVEVSSEGNWERLAFGDRHGNGIVLYQGDGVVVEEFALTGLDQIAAFDAGSFLLAPAAAQ